MESDNQARSIPDYRIFSAVLIINTFYNTSGNSIAWMSIRLIHATPCLLPPEWLNRQFGSYHRKKKSNHRKISPGDRILANFTLAKQLKSYNSKFNCEKPYTNY